MKPKSDYRTFIAEIDRIIPARGDIFLGPVGAVSKGGKTTGAEHYLLPRTGRSRRLCPALVYRFRVEVGSSELHSWAPLADQGRHLGRFLHYCGVRDASIEKKVGADPDSFLADPVGILAGLGVGEAELERFRRYLPPGYLALANCLFDVKASAAETSDIHAALVKREVPHQIYVPWLKEHALGFADDEDTEVSFAVLDALAVSPTHPERVKAALLSALIEQERGWDRQHTITRTKSALGRAADLVKAETVLDVLCTSEGGQPQLVDGKLPPRGESRNRGGGGGSGLALTHVKNKKTGTNEKWSSPITITDDSGERVQWTSRPVTSARESAIAKGLKAQASREPSHAVEVESGPDAAEIEAALSRGLTVLVGAAGTGKTHLAREIGKAAAAERLSVAWTATTGRAAQILNKVDGKTLHAHLGILPGALRFNCDEVDLLVVDEASMLDNALGGTLGRYMGSSTPPKRVLLVGDPFQLPPVGAGRVLADILAAPELSSAVRELTTVRRTDHAGILAVATAIRQGDELPDLTSLPGVDVIPATDVDAALASIVQTAQGKDWSECMVVCPVYAGPLGANALNEALRDAHLGHSDDEWLVDERVVQTSNVKLKDGSVLANGTFGTVTHVDGTVKVAYDGGAEVEWPSSACYIDNGVIAPAYALSIHRAQGGQAKTAVVVADPSRSTGMWADRAMGYTAVTRATERLVIVGEPDLLRGDRSRDRGVGTRRTALVERLAREFGAGKR